MAASKRFGKYTVEEEKAKIAPEPKANAAFEEFAGLWERYKLRDIKDVDGYRPHYERILGLFGRTNFSAQEIESISIMLSSLSHEPGFCFKAGLFLSAAIERSEELEFALDMHHYGEDVHYLCVSNRKNVVVNGDLGDFAAMDMHEGSVLVRGSASIAANDMSGGKLTIEGDAVEFVAAGMKGGEILVKGNVRSGSPGAFADYIHLEGGSLKVLGNVKCGGLSACGDARIIIKGDADINGDITLPSAGGRIRIFGNAECSSFGAENAEYGGGTIRVNGDVKANDIGKRMTCGMLIIGGKADAQIHPSMDGGEIHLEGDFGPETMNHSIQGGRIYHKGKLIVDLDY